MNHQLDKETYDLSTISQLLDSEYQENLREAFSKLGLNAYEAKILMSLYVLKESEAKTLAEVAQVPLGRIYTALENLTNNGLVQKIKIKGKPLRYRANDYQPALQTIYRSVREDIETAHSSILQKVSDLQKLEVKFDPDYPSEPVEVVFGDWNISQILRETILSTQEQITLFLSLPYIKNQKKALEKLVKKQCTIFAFSTTEEEIKELNSMSIHCNLLPPVLLSVFNMFFLEKNAIFNGLMVDFRRVFLILQETDNEPYGLIIRHPSLVQTFSILLQSLRAQLEE